MARAPALSVMKTNDWKCIFEVDIGRMLRGTMMVEVVGDEGY